MTKKRRKISEIAKEIEEINNWKPSQKEIEELAEVLNEEAIIIDNEDLPAEKVAIANIKDNQTNGIEQSRI